MNTFARDLNTLRTQSLAALRDALGDADRVALLDLPTHMNVGDSMILAGELDYLRHLGVQVSYDCDIARFDPDTLRRRHPHGPILLHGGGNFGDTWPQYQQFREDVIARYPDRRIIQLPQSVYFANEHHASRCRSILEAHPDFVLLCRDTQSAHRCAEYFPNTDVRLVPDMALGWHPEPPIRSTRTTPPVRVVLLARRDHESAHPLTAQPFTQPGREVRQVDWGLTGRELVLRKLLRLPGSLARRSAQLRRRRATYPVLRACYRQLLKQNLRAGKATVGGADVLVTDRLHAHVLACLLGVPHVVLDNSYGKISAIFSDYTSAIGESHLCANPAAAAQAVDGILTAPTTTGNRR